MSKEHMKIRIEELSSLLGPDAPFLTAPERARITAELTHEYTELMAVEPELRVLELHTEGLNKKNPCKGCDFDIGTKSMPLCKDAGFVISTYHGFKGGCDNPKSTSGIFVFKEKALE